MNDHDLIGRNIELMKVVLPKLGINSNSYREPYLDQSTETSFLCQQTAKTDKRYYRFIPSVLYEKSVVLIITSHCKVGRGAEFGVEYNMLEEGYLQLDGEKFKSAEELGISHLDIYIS